VIDVDVVGLPAASADRPDVPRAPGVRELCRAAAARAGLEHGHLAVEFVDAERIEQLNREHRGKERPTDVLSFPIDGPDAAPRAREHAHRRDRDLPERELGDVVICVEHTSDVREAIVHGVLHLAGMDHERDGGEMLAMQREVLAGAGIDPR
jgi:probable rRNA maturation factor